MRQHDVIVVGSGNAGISLAARLLRDGFTDVTIVSPDSTHRYRPLLNYVGGGEASMQDLERPTGELIPPGCAWVQDNVVAVDPVEQTLTTATGRVLRYSTLVLCPGMEEDWGATPGLREAYRDGWAASTYVPEAAARVWDQVTSLRSGDVLFSVPPEPAPCAPTALKPLFMACDLWRRTGVLADLRVRLVLPQETVTGLAASDASLERAFATYGIDVHRRARVCQVDGTARAVEVRTPAGLQTLSDLRFAHVVPHYRPPAWISGSGLADPATNTGLVDIDPTTLRHRHHSSVWAIGDAADLRTRSSGGALRHQVKVLSKNMRAARDGGDLQSYDGYTVMPVTVSRRRLLIAEVDRNGVPTLASRALGLARPKRLTWAADRYVLPQLYWHRLLKGKV